MIGHMEMKSIIIAREKTASYNLLDITDEEREKSQRTADFYAGN